MFWKKWFGLSADDDSAYLLYRALVNQARMPQFYLNTGVPDTLDGRFDLIVLHMYLVIDRLTAEGQAAGDLSQRLFDVMFDDMDQALREIGVGDLSVGKKVKTMARAFYGRLAAYDEAFRDGDIPALEGALKRNIFPEIEVEADRLTALAYYTRVARDKLSRVPLEVLREGGALFPPAPESVAADEGER
ncbi:MAG: ubiquinol-cytochrome C chaperone [Alphaproteobacteria bacterium]|jgi:cytochrome b pre-mRNA-processing protein 3|nr:ubiquinol-cytochrome C chaperone [Rhodobiaceae bacterium]MBO6542370.1 ubiquinol-cytochrome C chaperone [Alphaproteobacteria bacterium]MBO6629012.1 ubiquinol-cytochrome C chaperone [Alphaproteobacteria bacterium]MDF1624843.1 ubiquinol-cytochrome C chaperone family protein [Parvibaculaceae bacterium]